jgi:hypothetical protein
MAWYSWFVRAAAAVKNVVVDIASDTLKILLPGAVIGAVAGAITYFGVGGISTYTWGARLITSIAGLLGIAVSSMSLLIAAIGVGAFAAMLTTYILAKKTGRAEASEEFGRQINAALLSSQATTAQVETSIGEAREAAAVKNAVDAAITALRQEIDDIKSRVEMQDTLNAQERMHDRQTIQALTEQLAQLARDRAAPPRPDVGAAAPPVDVPVPPHPVPPPPAVDEDIVRVVDLELGADVPLPQAAIRQRRPAAR